MRNSSAARLQPIRVLEGQWTAIPQVRDLTPAELRAWRDLVAAESRRLRYELNSPSDPLSLRGGSEIEIRADFVAGTVALAPWSIEVAPKYRSSVDGDWPQDLLAMLARIRHSRLWELSNSGSVGPAPVSFVDHLAAAYMEALARAIHHDPIYVYRTFEETAPVVRGRLNLGRQLRSIYSRPHLLECDVERLDTDNEFNRLLSWASLRLAALVADAHLARRLTELQKRLPVTPLVRPSSRLRTGLPPQYRIWAEALEIADIVAGNAGQVGADTLVDGVSLCVSTPGLFEKFIEVSLQECVRDMPRTDLEVLPQAHADLAIPRHEEARTFRPQPDDVVFAAGQPALVIDAKYRHLHRSPTEPHGRFQREDAYQLVSSMVAHRCTVGVLIYPRAAIATSQEILSWEIDAFGVSMTVYVLELDLESLGTDYAYRSIDDQLTAAVEAALDTTARGAAA